MYLGSSLNKWTPARLINLFMSRSLQDKNKLGIENSHIGFKSQKTKYCNLNSPWLRRKLGLQFESIQTKLQNKSFQLKSRRPHWMQNPKIKYRLLCVEIYNKNKIIDTNNNQLQYFINSLSMTIYIETRSCWSQWSNKIV